MSKSSKNKKTEVVTIEAEPHVSIDIPVDSQHIADILVTTKEQRWLDEEQRLLEEMEEEQNKAAKKSEAYNSAVTKLLEKQKSEADAAIKELKKLGIKEVSVTVNKPYYGTDNSSYIEYNLRLEAGRTAIVSLDKKVKTTKKIKELEKACENSNKAVKSIQKNLTDVRKKLANIDRLQRIAKAQVGIAALQKTKEGRKFLAEVTGTTNLNLPLNLEDES